MHNLTVPFTVLSLIAATMAPSFARAADDTKPGGYDYSSYAAVLKQHVNDDGYVDYKSLKSDPAELNKFIKQLGTLDAKTFNTWSKNDQIALLINAYNAFTLRLIVDNYPIKAGFFASFAYPKNSIRQIDGAWDEIKWNLMGKKVTLEYIEHGILRKKYNEPRIHMAINCASVGCPPLRSEPFTGDRLGTQLADQSKRFLANTDKFRVDSKDGEVYLSPILKWFGEDFVKTYTPSRGFEGHGQEIRAVLNFASKHVGESDARYLRDAEYDTNWLDYDWSLNEQGK